MEKTETNNSINQEQKSNLKIQSFDISLKEKLFSIEISIDEKEENILFKGYEKSNVSKFIYKNTYNSKKLLEISKTFKICDDFKEIYETILQKFFDKEISLLLNDNLNINFEFILPNKKIDKISFVLQKEKINENELIEKLFENIIFLQEKNNFLQEQIKILSSKKKQKSFIEILSKKFKISNVSLLNDLYDSLKNFDLEDEYLNEIGNKFQLKSKTIYNFKKNEATIQSFISKVFGKKNLAGLVTYYYENNYYFQSNFVYLDGKLDFENGYLTFVTNGIFSYGNLNFDEFKFTHFRDNKAKVFIKILKDCVYFIIYETSENVRLIIKINNNFDKNPCFMGTIEGDLTNNDELINLFELSLKKEKEKKEKNNDLNEKNTENNKENDENEVKINPSSFYLKELKIFQIIN